MKVLLIEDEQHKAIDLKARLLEAGVDIDSLIMVSGVRQAVLEVIQTSFDLIVLDMALPTFSKELVESRGSGGIAQAVGGVEVLRALEMRGASTNIIIVTQYPEIVVDSTRVKLHQASKLISRKYRQNVIGAVLYSYNTPEWGVNFDNLIRRIGNQTMRVKK